VKNGFAVTTVSSKATGLLDAHADGGHVGRFLGDALRVGAVTIDELADRMELTREAVEALVAQGEPLSSEAADD